MEIILKRENNFIIKTRALKIYVDDVFIDYIEPNEYDKKIQIADTTKSLYIKLDWCYSNSYTFNENDDKSSLNFRITSQIQNGLFILIYFCFFTGWILYLINVIELNITMALTSPLAIIVFWQSFGRKNFLRLTKVNP